MRNIHAVFAHQRHLVFRGPDAVRHHGLDVGVNVIILAKQIVLVVRVPVEGIFRAQKFDKIDLTLAFRQM